MKTIDDRLGVELKDAGVDMYKLVGILDLKQAIYADMLEIIESNEILQKPDKYGFQPIDEDLLAAKLKEYFE
jgi:hypothetical protein